MIFTGFHFVVFLQPMQEHFPTPPCVGKLTIATSVASGLIICLPVRTDALGLWVADSVSWVLGVKCVVRETVVLFQVF